MDRRARKSRLYNGYIQCQVAMLERYGHPREPARVHGRENSEICNTVVCRG
jgi:hypothetical protein